MAEQHHHCRRCSYLLPILGGVLQGYGAQFIPQYVEDSGAAGDLNVGELWVDLNWEDGGEECRSAALLSLFEYTVCFLPALYAR